MSYSYRDGDNCLHSEWGSPTCEADTQQVGGEHTVQTLILHSLHCISSVTGKMVVAVNPIQAHRG